MFSWEFLKGVQCVSQFVEFVAKMWRGTDRVKPKNTSYIVISSRAETRTSRSEVNTPEGRGEGAADPSPHYLQDKVKIINVFRTKCLEFGKEPSKKRK